MSEMRSIDEMKQERDGHLSAGKYHPHDPRLGMWPKVTSVGYNAEGRAVAVCRAFSMDSGDVEYRSNDDVNERVVRWEDTEFGKVLAEHRATP